MTLSPKDSLLERIRAKSARVGVVGLGYVGLPLAVEKGKAGFAVVGFDRNAKRVGMVNRAENYIGDVVQGDLEDLVKSGRLRATDRFEDLAGVDAVAVCVPTPLTETMDPDISYIEAVTAELAKHLHPGMLIVLESTTYPGTTEEVMLPALERSGLEVGVDFFLAFSPERVDPGNLVFKTKNTPKVVGGVTAACREVAKALYEQIIEGIHVVTSPKVAELEKLFENTFRNVNIALVNELAILCEKLGISVWEVIEAASTKPYGFMLFYPGPGVGGHCIPIDPFYLSWKARQYDFNARFIELSGDINVQMPYHVVSLAADRLNDDGMALRGCRVLVLGVAYKKNIDDFRESPALKIIEILQHKGAVVTYTDPHVPEFSHHGLAMTSVPFSDETLAGCDLAILVTEHAAFDAERIAAKAPRILDTRNFLKNVKGRRDHIRVLGVGGTGRA